MKNVLTCLALLIFIIGFSQSENTTKNDLQSERIEYNSLDLVITVDSLKELESQLNTDDFKALYDDIKEFKNISFKLVCNTVGSSKTDKKAMSIKIETTTDNKDYFLNRIQKIKDLAINYYLNNN